mgnify:FL=1
MRLQRQELTLNERTGCAYVKISSIKHTDIYKYTIWCNRCFKDLGDVDDWLRETAHVFSTGDVLFRIPKTEQRTEAVDG